MTTKTQIEWTEQTWNPTTGCTKVSAGCKHCYAEVMAKRLKAMGANGYQNGFELSLLPDRLNQPIKRKKPTTYFVNSMSDLFHEDVPFSFIDKVFDVIRQTPQHRYQVLTKRENQLFSYFKNTFFENSGRPKYYHTRVYPVDIQCSSQAIDTLAYFSEYNRSAIDLAIKIAKWTIDNMQDKDGYFYYRILPFKKVKTPMLHWGQATMYKALTHLLLKIA